MLNLDTLMLVRLEHPWNMDTIYVALAVLKLDTLMLDSLEQP